MTYVCTPVQLRNNLPICTDIRHEFLTFDDSPFSCLLVCLQNYKIIQSYTTLSLLEVLVVFLATCFGSYTEPPSG